MLHKFMKLIITKITNKTNKKKGLKMNEKNNETTISAEEMTLVPEHKSPRKVEVPELRGEKRKVFHLNNKEQQAVFYPTPVHVFNEETQMYEETADILTEEEDNKRFSCRRNHFAANFCKEKESNRLFTVESGEHRVTVFTKPESEDGSSSKKGTHVGKGIVPTKNRKQQLGKKKESKRNLNWKRSKTVTIYR